MAKGKNNKRNKNKGKNKGKNRNKSINNGKNKTTVKQKTESNTKQPKQEKFKYMVPFLGKSFNNTLNRLAKDGLYNNNISFRDGLVLTDLTHEKEIYLDRWWRLFISTQEKISVEQKIDFLEVNVNDVLEAIFDKYEDISDPNNNKMLRMIAWAWENIPKLKGEAYYHTLFELYYFCSDFAMMREYIKKKSLLALLEQKPKFPVTVVE